MTETPLYKWRVKRSEHGMSLENFIYRQLGDCSHKQVKQAIDSKRAFINGRNVFIGKWNVKHNDAVTFSPPAKGGGVSVPVGKTIGFIDVLFEDTYIILANKPPFVEHEAFARSVQDYLKRRNRGQVLPYLGQLHRLDKETSGVMAFTKKKIANTFADQFRDHSIGKTYVAVVDGALQREQGELTKSIEKGRFAEGKKARVTAKGDGRSAETHYRVMERYDNTTFVKVEIKTGRTHQIRVHFADMGFPIIGDKLYGRTDGVPFKRQALHAQTLAFRHPVTGQKLKVEAPLPKDLSSLIDRLRGI